MSLVLEQKPWIDTCQPLELTPYCLIESGRRGFDDGLARGNPHFGAMAANCRGEERREEVVEAGNPPAADKGNRTAGTFNQIAQDFAQHRWHDDVGRRHRDVKQRAVDVQKQGDPAQVDRLQAS